MPVLEFSVGQDVLVSRLGKGHIVAVDQGDGSVLPFNTSGEVCVAVNLPAPPGNEIYYFTGDGGMFNIGRVTIVTENNGL